MIIITGAAGFIGSCMVAKLNEERFFDLILVDDFTVEKKKANYKDKTFSALIQRDQLFNWLKGKEADIQFIIHLGARTDTTESDDALFQKLNYSYSREIWRICTDYQIPLIYASSAATYGDGSHGFSDREYIFPRLSPLNAYGRSKHEFDMWALQQTTYPFYWTGLKFFNVYGPNEYHKGRMASVIYHAFHQIKKTHKLRLFRSHRPDFKNGEQKRDFIYVKDIVEVIFFLMNTRKQNGIYNLGTGNARTFNDLATSVFTAMEAPVDIEYIDTPLDIRDNYQYFTEAEMNKLITLGYSHPFRTLEEGIRDYVTGYLTPCKYY